VRHANLQSGEGKRHTFRLYGRENVQGDVWGNMSSLGGMCGSLVAASRTQFYSTQLNRPRDLDGKCDQKGKKNKSL